MSEKKIKVVFQKQDCVLCLAARGGYEVLLVPCLGRAPPCRRGGHKKSELCLLFWYLILLITKVIKNFGYKNL